jgi:hypothetical protein
MIVQIRLLRIRNMCLEFSPKWDTPIPMNEQMVSPSTAVETAPQAFGWWPRSKAGGIVQCLILLSALWQANGGFFHHIYSTLVGFFLITVARFAWDWFNRGQQRAPLLPRWQNPGFIAIGFCAIHYVLILPLVKPGDMDTADVRRRVETALNATKQTWFDRFHPIGTAKSVKLHDVKVEDTPQGKRTTARFTLYWEGPLTKDGFTKIVAIHDAESNRWVRAEILETNGTTKTQVMEGVGAFIEGYLQAQ